MKVIPNLLENWLKTSDPLIVALTIAILLATYSFIASINSGDCSYIDRQWSIVPWAYTWVFYAYSNGNPRNLLMSILATLWGLRLTFNFWRKGGYNGEEDYRWAILRKHPILGLKPVWFIFNLTFISLYQEILLLWFVIPSYFVMKSGNSSLNYLDYFLIVTFVITLTLETVADQQQWNFQKEKYRRIK